MVYLRATQKVLRRLPPKAPEGEESDSALGDWFVNRLVVDRQPLLILVSGSSLLPILEPARDVRSLPTRLPSIVKQRLERLGARRNLIALEVEAMRDVLVAPTNDRSVVGTMIDFVKAVPYHLPEGVRWGEYELYDAEAKLAVTPCRCSSRDTVFPDREAAALLAAKWIGEPSAS
jgi:hypothetical protein